MTIFYAGNELDVYNPLVASCLENTSITAAFDSAYSRCSIQCGAFSVNGSSTGFSHPNIPARSNLWLSWQDTQAGGALVLGGGTVIGGIRDNLGNYLIRIVTSGTGANRQFQVWDGVSAWANVGAIIVVPLNARNRYDLFVDFPNRILRVWIGGVLTIDATLPVSAIGFQCVNAVWNNCSDADHARYCSEIIVADENTLAMRVLTIPAVANGAETAWAGTVTDINEIVLNDATAITTSTIGALESFTINTPTIPANFSLRALCIGARASSNSVSPDDLEGLMRVDGDNYFSAPRTIAGIGGNSIVFDNNPATSAPWAVSDLAAANLQFGFAARA
jgi:hypothetical protein